MGLWGQFLSAENAGDWGPRGQLPEAQAPQLTKEEHRAMPGIPNPNFPDSCYISGYFWLELRLDP